MEITGLLTTVTAATDRVAVHRVRRVLLQAQADTLGLHVVELPRPCPNDVYEQRMTEAMASARQAGAEQLGSSFAGEGGGVEAWDLPEREHDVVQHVVDPYRGKPLGVSVEAASGLAAE